MMKYIFCILLGVFLNWGFHLISDEAQEAYQSEAGSTSIQTYTNSYTSKTCIIQLDKEQKLVKTKEYTGKQDYNNDNGVLNPFSFRHLSPLKILRFNIPSVTIRILSSLKIQLPQNQWTGFSYYTNLFKYSDRYHIYSFSHFIFFRHKTIPVFDASLSVCILHLSEKSIHYGLEANNILFLP